MNGSIVAERDNSHLGQDYVAQASDSLLSATTRCMGRALAVGFCSLLALAEISVTIPFVGSSERCHLRAAWLHRWCRIACRILGIRLTIDGTTPRAGLLVCNHLSYLDVIVLSSITPCVFVAKRDVASWPLFGWLARAAGTIFADRRSKVAVGGVVDQIREAISDGALVVLFPEGTSSDGSTVLPFKSALLEPAIQLDCNISAAAIDYSVPHGSVADEVCYWRDMTLFPHLLNLFTKETISAKLVISPSKACSVDRKAIARELRSQIISLRS